MSDTPNQSKFRQLNFSEIDQYYPILTSGESGEIAERAGEFLYIYDMYRRSVDFAKVAMQTLQVDLLPDNLRGVFKHLIVAAVENDAEVLRQVVDPFLGFGDAGRIAAATLKPGFRVEDARQIARATDAKEPLSTTIEIVATYREFGGEDKKIRFEFKKSEPKAKYLLSKFTM